ncbi:MAG: hypothetical protein UHW99_04035, partial [Methanobrevibacter sp.]|nr:hypothetical protein [Methanobrevibacter sp.]
MRYFGTRNLLKISIISILLIMCMGSIYAADNTTDNSLTSQDTISNLILTGLDDDSGFDDELDDDDFEDDSGFDDELDDDDFEDDSG